MREFYINLIFYLFKLALQYNNNICIKLLAFINCAIAAYMYIHTSVIINIKNLHIVLYIHIIMQ